ncbi:MAG TPA: folylpolyglutamate synthase/dihydrofolate synthase family protein [Candidatus Paceibacterota bacterium]|nr:folylpolyglutamate synthase/dihydrofolate synthase family protein [Verrucomicrobiota bacterium]HSA12534.1 folylpolyglutamate synthase/dihydrofolate synthase family protein [Candidatus Paceibacterota bacterium]
MTYPHAIRFLYNLRWFGAKLGLSNTFKLAALAGNPQDRLRFIHVAGTNGKGSTCAMLESIYRTAGLRVGLFTSPHLVAFGERIQVNRHPLSQRETVRLVAEMQPLLEDGWGTSGSTAQALGSARTVEPRGPVTPPSSGVENPTFFEVVTIMALRHFVERQCDLVIWETGLGGRLDSTNIVTPLLSVITNIQYDHQEWLGETLASIAAEKAGIIKPGIPVITATEGTEPLKVLADTARRQKAPLTTLSSQEALRPPLDTLQLPLLGQHQRMNAAVAVATVRALAPQLPAGEDTIRAGLAHVHWAGRLQLVTRPTGQKVLLDGAHNVSGAQILVAAVKDYFPSAKPTLVLGILRDKDWPGMCRILAPLAGRILLVPAPSERSATPQELAEACRRANPTARVSSYPSLGEALASTSGDDFVTVAGSLYLVGEAMELLHLSPAKPADERGLNEWSSPTTPLPNNDVGR